MPILLRPDAPPATRVAVVGGNGKTGRAVVAALAGRGVDAVTLGRADRGHRAERLAGCDAAYLIAPNFLEEEHRYVVSWLSALADAGVDRVVYHSVAAPYLPAMPHHLRKAAGEVSVRGRVPVWTILQPGPYLQNFDLAAGVDLEVPYDPDALFGFVDLAEVGEAAAVVLTEPGHVGATYELATRLASVRQLVEEAGVGVRQVENRAEGDLAAMFHHYDRHGLPVGTRVLDLLLGRHERRRP